MRVFRLISAFFALAFALPGATLERLSMDEMSVKATDIVRARAGSARTAYHGSILYTYYSLDVLERWKGGSARSLEIAVPGGTLAGARQVFPGTPTLAPGQEYVLFLWTGPSGTTQVMGLSQGMFEVNRQPTGAASAFRAATTELMLDAETHRAVQDVPVRMDLSELKGRVSAALSRGGAR